MYFMLRFRVKGTTVNFYINLISFLLFYLIKGEAGSTGRRGRIGGDGNAVGKVKTYWNDFDYLSLSCQRS